MLRYMSPIEAKEYGIIDHIIGGEEVGCVAKMGRGLCMGRRMCMGWHISRPLPLRWVGTAATQQQTVITTLLEHTM